MSDIAARLQRVARRCTAASRSAGTWATRARSATATRCGSKGFLDGLGSAALLLGRLAGREQPLRRLGAALRVAAARPDPRPQADRLPADGGREPARLARLGAVGAARARAAERRSSIAAGAWWSSIRGAPRRRASTSTCRSARTRTPGCCCRCCTCLRRGPRRTATFLARARARRRGSSRERARDFTPERDGARRPASPAERVRELARAFAAAPSAAAYGRTGLVPGPLRHARRLPARRAERRHRQPRPARRRRVRPPADRARRDRREGRARDLRQDPLADRRTTPT